MSTQVQISEVPLEIREVVSEIIKELNAKIVSIEKAKCVVADYDYEYKKVTTSEDLKQAKTDQLEGFRIITWNHGYFTIWQLKTGRWSGAIMTHAFEGDAYCLKGNMPHFKNFTLRHFLDNAKACGKIKP